MRLIRLAAFAIFGALAGVAIAVFASSLLAPSYQASFTISPAQSSGKSSSISLDVPFGGDLLDGLSGGSSGPGRVNYDRFLAVLSGRGIAQEIATSPALMHRIFAPQWDAVSRKWHPAGGIAATTGRQLRQWFGIPGWQPPGPDDVMRYLDSHLIVTPLRKGTMHEIAIVSADPKLSLDLTRFVLERADATLRSHDLGNAAFNISYLRDQLAVNSIAELRGSISRDLSSEMLKQMQVRNPRPYGIEIFSEPALQSRPIFPNPPIMTLFGLLGGAVLGLLLAFLTANSTRQDEPELLGA